MVKRHRQPGHDYLLVINDALGTESASHVRSNNPQLGIVKSQHCADDGSHHVGRLRGGPDGEPVIQRIVHGEDSTAFHRVSGAAMLPIGIVQFVRRLRQGLVGIAYVEFHQGGDVVF